MGYIQNGIYILNKNGTTIPVYPILTLTFPLCHPQPFLPVWCPTSNPKCRIPLFAVSVEYTVSHSHRQVSRHMNFTFQRAVLGPLVTPRVGNVEHENSGIVSRTDLSTQCPTAAATMSIETGCRSRSGKQEGRT